jgi:MFS family permease
MTLGSCLAVLAILAWAQVQTMIGFYLVWLAIGGINAMILYEPAFAVTATWFVRHRRQALTLLTLGGGLASVIFVPLATWLVGLYGWRSALWILAGILAVTTIPLHALVLRRGPAAVNALPDGDPLPKADGQAAKATPRHDLIQPGTADDLALGVALRESCFWWLSLAFALSTFAGVALSVHLLPFLTTQGYPTTFAASTASVLGGSQIPGRLIFGPLGSRLSLRLVTALLFTMMLGGLLILLVAPTTGIILLGAALFGMGSGASSPARAALVGEFYGIAHYGAINGAMTLVLTVARSAAPVALGLLYTWTGAYTVVFWVLILSAAAAAGSILAARKFP